MNQEQLARQMHKVVYAQRKLSYLQEKLTEALAHNSIVLLPEQRVLSAANVEAALTHEQHINEAKDAIRQEENTVQTQTENLLQSLPDIIKDLIRKGMPLMADWPADGIQSLALVYKEETFSIIPHNQAVAA